MNWKGVMPAITTAFHSDFSVDYATVRRHAEWLVENGCTGIICLGSLGEAATLNFDEKVGILNAVVGAVGNKVPVVSAVSALSTAEAVQLAQAAHGAGCSGLMILPQYVYKGDWRENKAHVSAILKATPCLECSITTRSPTARIFCPSRLKNSPASSPTSQPSKSLPPMCGESQLFAPCLAIAWPSSSVSMMPLSKASLPVPWDGSPAL